ncbi:MAG: alpha/beta hydrolase [Dehalococcoidia bacterium]|nr:MAG: alpha/beta hydrolase [Dehalococcoidia bacterium]
MSAVRCWLIGLVATLMPMYGSLACGGQSGGVLPRDLVWTGCGGAFQCATLDVPIDYNHAGGKKVTLALTRLPASDSSQRIGVLLVNPGGPGASGISLAHFAATAFPANIRARFDIVGWDPRGVGQSSRVRCDDAPVPTVEPATAAPIPRSTSDPELQAAIALGEACFRGTGELLGFVDTESNARDMEQIRLALREDVISYIGYSYGTFLGAQYADLYPSRARAFVLDAGVDPSLDRGAQIEGQAVALERALHAFLSDCAARPSCPFYSDGDPASHLQQLRLALNASPIKATTPSGSSVTLDGDQMLGQAVGNGLVSGNWGRLAEALADVEYRHDGTGIARLLGGETVGSNPQNTGAANLAITCLDTTRIQSQAWNQLIERLRAVFTEFPLTTAPPSPECEGWPFEPRWRPRELHAKGAAPILVIGTTDDPLVPYEWSQSLARQLSAGRLLTWQGHAHTASFSHPSVSSCIDSAVTAYLIDLKLPGEGTVCQ